MSARDDKAARQALSLLRLAIEGAVTLDAAGERLETGRRGRRPSRATAETLIAEGLAIWDEGRRLVATDAGRARLRRAGGGARAFAAQHLPLETLRLVIDGSEQEVTVDLAESPLAWLRRHGRGADGGALIDDAAFAAGERLRREWTFGGMTPRITQRWDATPRGGHGAGAVAESTLAARERVRRALDAVGPELSGVLVDVCCFLRGLEAVESERRWPARSAKVVLAMALAALARHYGYAAVAVGRRTAPTRHWRAPGARPTVDGA